LSNWWKILTKSRYTRFLEADNERLREELRLWQDATRLAQGLPRITPVERAPLPATRGRMLPSQFKSKMEKLSQPVSETKQ